MASNIRGFTRSHLNNGLFKDILKGIDENAVFKSCSQVNLNLNSGFGTDIIQNSEKGQERVVGILFYQLEYTLPHSNEVIKKLFVLKSKARGYEMIESFSKLVPESEYEFLRVFKQYANQLELGTVEYRELLCVEFNDITLHSIMPKTYWSKMDEHQDIYVYVMEYLEPEMMSHMDSVNDVHIWEEGDILEVLDGFALFHAKFYNQLFKLPNELRKYIDIPCEKSVLGLKPLWEASIERNVKTENWTIDAHKLAKKILRNLPYICDVLDHAPRTLLHNDATPMNLCLRKESTEGKHRLCLYDWENCSTGPPQHDVAEFLAFILLPNTDIEKWHFYVKKYHSFLKKYLAKFQMQSNNNSLGKHGCENEDLEFVDFEKVFDMCMCEWYISRHNWACSIFTPVYKSEFVPRLLSNMVQYVTYAADKYNFT